MTTSVQLTATARRTIFDGATLFGLAGALALIAMAMILGGRPDAFFSAPAVLIVIGGTLGATIMCFSLPDVTAALGAMTRTVFYRERDAQDAAYTMVELADFCRKHGALKLQGEPLDRFHSEPVLRKGLQLVMDGLSEADIQNILANDIRSESLPDLKAANVLRKAAEVAPAMGLIGTLIGLVQMLGRLDNPDAIGPAMAVALLTTFYGALLANLVFNPTAAKLERNAQEEQLINSLYVQGVLSIVRRDNPRRLEMELNGALPSTQKVTYFQ